MGAKALSQRLIDDLFKGAMNDVDNPDVTRLAGRTAPQSTTRGIAQIMPTVDTLARGADKGVAEGVTPERLEREYAQLSYIMKVFKQTTGIPFAEANDFSQNHNEELAETEMNRCVRTSHIKAALHLSDVLGYDSFDDTQIAQADQNNIHVDASLASPEVDGNVVSYLEGTAWDASGGVPLSDIKALITNVIPGADYAIAGRQILDDMGKRAEFTTIDRQFSGGSVSRSRVMDIIVGETNIEKVETFRSFFNTADQGLSASKKFLFSKGFWLGYGRDLVWMPLAQENPRSIREENREDEETAIGTSMRGVYKRPVRDLGVSVKAFT